MITSEQPELDDLINHVNLSAKDTLPTTNKPERGDLWLSKDNRMIVVTNIDKPSFGNITRIHACINGEWLEPCITLWPMVLLSLQAKPLGKLKVTC